MKNLLLLILIFHCALSASAEDTIYIDQGNTHPTPIAINHFAGFNNNDTQIAQRIVSVIVNDLKHSGIFKPISPAAFIETKTGIRHKPLFAAWQQINASMLINGEVALVNGQIQVKFTLWDTILESEMISQSYVLPERLWRRVAHKIADSIYARITGNDGYFNTKIVYVAESGPYLKRVKRLAIMDQDGANHRYLTDGSDLVLTPRFSPDHKRILYLSYKNKTPQVYIYDLRTGISQLLGHFHGMSFAPKFSPDSEYVVMSIAKGGATHIYEMHLKTKRIRQLTQGTSINTSPSYSPDGKSIAFNSNKNGTRQIFIMDRASGNTRQVSWGKGTYAEPNWSNLNLLAFTKISRTIGFAIGVMSLDGERQKNERLIASGYLVESPAWAYNGRVLVFTKGSMPKKTIKGLNRLYMIDFTGYNERIIPTPDDASDPDWSRPLD